jgi:UDP-glucose:(heptosyl)LPS alpha-1,3-glucosyltransferase
MKVALVIERADVVLGGAERSVLELAQALRKAGLQVELLAATRMPERQEGTTNSQNLHILFQAGPGKRTSLSRFSRKLREKLSQDHYDIVHSVLPFDFADVYQPRGGSFAEAAIRNAASYETTLGRTYKSATSFANRRRAAMLRAERRLCKDPKGPLIAAVSEYVRRQFQKHYALSDERIAVIPNGVKIFGPIDREYMNKLRSQLFEQLQINETTKPLFFLFVANNFRLKGLAPLLSAFQLLTERASSSQPYLLIAGRDKSSKYRKIAARLGIEQRILFLGRIKRIQNLLEIADVAVLPTFYDPCSRYILEALAADKPVITTRFNGAADFIVDGRHGKIIDNPRQIDALADAMSHFTNPTNIQNASRAITNDNLKEKISIHRHATELIKIYETIIQNKRQ